MNPGHRDERPEAAPQEARLGCKIFQIRVNKQQTLGGSLQSMGIAFGRHICR